MKPAHRTRSPHAPIPIIEEHAEVAKTVEETGAVRVRIETERVRESSDVGTDTMQVEVQRVPVNVIADERRAPWTEDGVLVVPIYEEVLVRRLMLKEEIRLVRRRSTEQKQSTVLLRHDHAVVERRQADGSWQRIDVDDAAQRKAGRAGKGRESETKA